MTKAAEIKKIEAVEKILVPVIEEATTYISDIFNIQDFQQMISNIKNDFAIEHETQIGAIKRHLSGNGSDQQCRGRNRGF